MNSVLIVRLSAMGDLVQSLGAIEGLVTARAEVSVTVVTQAPYAPLLQGFPGLKRVVAFRRDGGLRALREVRAALREDRYSVAIDLQGNWKSALIARLSGARTTIGAGSAARREPWSRLLLHGTVPIAGAPHPARVALQLIRSIAPSVPPRLPSLQASEAELAEERSAVAAAGVDPSRPFLVVVVTDPTDPRALRPETVAQVIASSPMPVLLLRGPAEAGLPASRGIALLQHGANQVRRLIALGAAVGAASGRVLGPDQGAVHVLAAAGAPCTVMFGAQDPRRTAPPGSTVVVHPHPPACSPCRRRSCRHPDGPVCMQFDPASGRAIANDPLA